MKFWEPCTWLWLKIRFFKRHSIRMNQAAGASTLADELRPHKVGGMSFHRVPTDPELKTLVVLLCQKPSKEQSPRAF